MYIGYVLFLVTLAATCFVAILLAGRFDNMIDDDHGQL